jgi:hypothetical protein
LETLVGSTEMVITLIRVFLQGANGFTMKSSSKFVSVRLGLKLSHRHNLT